MNDYKLREMKFCNKYEELMQELGHKKLPRIGCRKLKYMLESCRKELHSQNNDDGISNGASKNPCPVCDGTFFPLLLKEMSAVVTFFNKRAQILLDRHLASHCSKCFIWLEDRLLGNQITLIQECENLVTYASINAIAMRRILKKYDKIHYSKQGQDFKSRSQNMQIEILQSPWLYELMAFHINLRDSNTDKANASALLEGCSLVFNDTKPSLCIELVDLVKLDIDLTCSICLCRLAAVISFATCARVKLVQ